MEFIRLKSYMAIYIYIILKWAIVHSHVKLPEDTQDVDETWGAAIASGFENRKHTS